MRLPGRPPALSVASPLPLFLGRALQGQAIPHFRADFAWTLGLSVGQSALSPSSSAQGHFRSSGPVGCPRNSVTSPYRRRNSIAALPTIQFSRFIMCDFLQPHGQQHARLPCPTPTPRASSNSCHWTWNNRLFQIREAVDQGCILPPCLFNLSAEYIM